MSLSLRRGIKSDNPLLNSSWIKIPHLWWFEGQRWTWILDRQLVGSTQSLASCTELGMSMSFPGALVSQLFLEEIDQFAPRTSTKGNVSDFFLVLHIHHRKKISMGKIWHQYFSAAQGGKSINNYIIGNNKSADIWIGYFFMSPGTILRTSDLIQKIEA